MQKTALSVGRATSVLHCVRAGVVATQGDDDHRDHLLADVSYGSFSDLGARSCEVRFTSMNGHRQADPACPLSAITGSQLISRSLVGAPFLAKASWLYKQDAREVHRS